MKNKISVIELFAGVGGLSYGFSKNPSFEIIAANEIDKDIATAYSMNHPKTKMINKDICEITIDDFRDVSINNLDLVIGGPPCQSYSTLGKRQMDERANLFKQYKRILHILDPQAFIFENVVGILSMNKGKLFEKIQDEFKELGYKLQYQVLNAVEFGVPQVRERVILVGTKNNTKHYNFPNPTHGEGKTPFVTLEDALSDLPILKSGETSCEFARLPDNDFLRFVRTTSILSEHKAPKNGAHLIKIMETLQDGQSKNDLPEEIRPKSGYGNTYAKLWWKRPSTTITRNFACPSSSRCVHPRDSRAMSIREGARLQSFPDDYIFYGSASTKRLEIGNAVPPLLSIHIANQAQKMFE